MSEERYWIESARMLARLLERIPGLRDSDFGDDPLEFLANYVPAQGSLDETTESLRRVFLRMSREQFRSVYETYLEERGKPGFYIGKKR